MINGIPVTDRYPSFVGLYRVWTGNNAYPNEFEVNFNGFAFDWMDEAITHWKEIGAQERHLNRLGRGEVKEPKWGTALKLLDYYYDCFPDEMDKERM